jgi:hypothetical protein
MEFMQQWAAIMSEVYCETLTELRRAGHSVQKAWNADMLHDNARPHRAVRTRALLEHFSCELFEHPPFSPDRVPSDYHLFTYRRNGWDHSASTIVSLWKESKRG